VGNGGTYDEIRTGLLASYGAEGASRRDRLEKPQWKVTEMAEFLRRLQAEGCGSLLEIGAGTGQDSAYFAAAGLDVTATDMSPEMVSYCRAKGLDARVMDFSKPDAGLGPFDALYAMNCLLHVPNAELPAVLESLRRLLRPGGLFFLGVYGGSGEEGLLADDEHIPPRFFSWRTDEQILEFARTAFEVVDFHVVPLQPDGFGFQSLTLRGRRSERRWSAVRSSSSAE
jgi:SAM-dependent methyltransferase